MKKNSAYQLADICFMCVGLKQFFHFLPGFREIYKAVFIRGEGLVDKG
jgi:hypothetical protein